MKKGLFVTFEGIDGSGKSTQMEIIAEVLRSFNVEVVTTREPGGTELAEKVRALVLDKDTPLTVNTQTLLYLAARSEHVHKVIRPALNAGKVVLCDRFSDSTMVYQGLAANKGFMELEQLKELNNFATGYLTPDITFILDAEPEALLERREARGTVDRYEAQGLDFQHKLRDGFLNWGHGQPDRVRFINALGAQEEVAGEIFAAIAELLPQAGIYVG